MTLYQEDILDMCDQGLYIFLEGFWKGTSHYKRNREEYPEGNAYNMEIADLERHIQQNLRAYTNEEFGS